MKKAGMPLTRHNYLNFVYMGEPPDEIEEASLPPELRHDAYEEDPIVAPPGVKMTPVDHDPFAQ
jgi:hypothetical protein